MTKISFLDRGLIVAMLIGALGFSACGDEPTGPGTETGAPPLPDLSTMMIDLSFFGIETVGGSSTGGTLEDGSRAAGDRSNWIEAAVRALYVKLTFYDAFEEPVGAFAAAVNTVPQQQPDGSWLWTFIFVEGGIEYGIYLNGIAVEDHVEWRMEVSSDNPEFPLDHFVWFDGESMIDDSAGFWQFYVPGDVATSGTAVTVGVPSVRIDWTNPSPYEHRLTLLVNEVGSPDEGDWLQFYDSSSVSRLDYHNEDLQQDSNITWYPDGSGSITVPDYNGGFTACWDTNQQNVACP